MTAAFPSAGVEVTQQEVEQEEELIRNVVTTPETGAMNTTTQLPLGAGGYVTTTYWRRQEETPNVWLVAGVPEADGLDEEEMDD